MIKAVIIMIVIAFTIFSIYTGSHLLVFIDDPSDFRIWMQSFGVFAPLVYILVTVIQILIPLIPGEPMEILAGYAFGSLKGTFLCLLAESIGSIIVLLTVKKYGRKIVEIFFKKEKIDSLSFLRSSKNRIISFALIFTAPGTPKDLLCYFAGLTDIDKRVLIPLITLGRFPSIITSTMAGSMLGEKSYLQALIYILAAAILSLTGVFIYRKIQQDADKEKGL